MYVIGQKCDIGDDGDYWTWPSRRKEGIVIN